MNLQRKIFEAGLELSPDELAALAQAEALLREKAPVEDRTAGLGVDDSTKPDDFSGLGIDEI
ncbi:MAG: hypothetical protein WC886_06280 [Saccharofermentanaceae bacterium]|jgi:hypothetical protein